MGNLFGFISSPMEVGLIWLAHAVGNAGIGIILFTIFIRLILAPLTISQLRNARNMQKIQPMVQELRKKHGSDKQALTQATMALYKEHQVNPAMGCLPMLLQFPILIGLFYALLHLGSTPFNNVKGHQVFSSTTCNGHAVHTFAAWLKHCYGVSGASADPYTVYNLFHAQFLWLSNGLGQPDPLYILPLLAGATQWIQSRMMLTKTTDPQAQTMNTMMNFMPLMIIFFALRYASGLSLYWVTSTVIGIIIQYRITGWGLLPRPATVLAFAGGLGNRSAQPQRRSAPKAGPSTPKPSPAVAADGDGQTGSTGDNGSGSRPANRDGNRPRAKARRPKGGRGGGRRG